ncbi:MAG: formate dehydrogenase accessory protein FdhE [Desulfovibrio sp.]|nr:formate dehydrogenase accessory protein FdhE [Desulfovibrio sp.]
MQVSRQSATETLNEIASFRPALKSILDAFAPLLEARDALAQEVMADLKNRQITLPACQASRLSLGVSLLSDQDLPDLGDSYAKVAQALVPQLEKIPALSQLPTPLAQVFQALSVEEQKTLCEAVCTNSPKLLTELATKYQLDTLVLNLAASFVVSTLLRGLCKASFEADQEKPWDTNNIWQKGYCPVCGSYPVLAWLDKPVIDERNTYLHEGGGRKHLYCGICGSDWRFLRLACPACGVSQSRQIEILTEETNTHGEALDWCTKCKSYCPTVDMRERINIPHLDAQALGMLHLELIAWEKKLKPLRASFWNTFA